MQVGSFQKTGSGQMYSLILECGGESLAFVLVSLFPVVTLAVNRAVPALFASGALLMLNVEAFGALTE